MAGTTLSTKLKRDNGSFVTLDVECSISGRYRPAKISGDPDNCFEAEYPEIDPGSAKWTELEDVNGEMRNPDEGESDVFELGKLSEAETSRLIDGLYESLRDHGGDSEPDYDPPDDCDDDDQGWQGAQDRWEHSQGI